MVVEVGRRGKANPVPVCVGYVDAVFQTASEIKILGFFTSELPRA